MQLREFVLGVRDFLFPAACAICRELLVASDDGLICRTCWARMSPLGEPVCRRCGHPRLSPSLPRAFAPGETSLPDCRWCERLPPFVRSARSLCRMDKGTGAAMVHALKYGGWPRVASGMASRMSRLSFPSDVREERTAVVPVPLSTVRLRERGYNQAEELARWLARAWEIPMWSDVLVRVRHTRSQVELTPSERAHNVSNAFTVVDETRARLRTSHVVLVDDVITTAATLNAAAAALAEGGVRIISYVSFGRAPDPGDRSDSQVDLDE